MCRCPGAISLAPDRPSASPLAVILHLGMPVTTATDSTSSGLRLVTDDGALRHSRRATQYVELCAHPSDPTAGRRCQWRIAEDSTLIAPFAAVAALRLRPSRCNWLGDWLRFLKIVPFTAASG